MANPLINFLSNIFSFALRQDTVSPKLNSEAEKLRNSRVNRRLLQAQALNDSATPYDENLLERARTQWHFGDWYSLRNLSQDTLQHHPDRAKLALLAAAGRLQTGDDGEAKELILLAQDWGCSKKLIAQILIAGVHNSIGRAASLTGQQARAFKHFEAAIATGTPDGDVKLLTQARIYQQLNQLNLGNGAANMMLNAPPDEKHGLG